MAGLLCPPAVRTLPLPSPILSPWGLALALLRRVGVEWVPWELIHHISMMRVGTKNKRWVCWAPRLDA
eukprot:scaffold6470_cov124-Isochrysis_galbana.AAC.5